MGNEGSSLDASPGVADEDGKFYAVGRPRDMTEKTLARYNGVGDRHAYIGIGGVIYDVTTDVDSLEEYLDRLGTNIDNPSESEIERFENTYSKIGEIILPRVISKAELAQATGEQGQELYICARGLVFDVQTGESFYGLDGGYHVFAGKNAQRALALMSLEAKDVENTNLDDLSEKDIQVLDDWIQKYYDKYPMIGMLEGWEEEEEHGEAKCESKSEGKHAEAKA
mmetsp:Transcript_14854/g.24181  ORF Transcript_14854/g.24181 Transcript_14854/m.24181 type:complete len:225 (+) Transcript_14854:193-867(+)